MVLSAADEVVQDLRTQLALGASLLASHGLIAPFGHPSIRIPHTDAICILSHPYERGSQDMTKTTLEDVVVIDLDGEVLIGKKKPPGERFIHTEIYRRRPEIRSVAHTHPVACIALSTVGKVVSPVWSHSTMFRNAVSLLDYSGQIDTPKLGDEVASVLGSGRSVFLRGHGIVTVGASIQETCVDSVYLEKTAHLQIMASATGVPQAIPNDQLTEESFTKGITRAGYYDTMWRFLTIGL